MIGDSELWEPLEQLHRQFLTPLQSSLQAVAGTNLEAQFVSTEFGTYGQFVFRQPIPTCCAVVRVSPLDTEFCVSIRPSIFYPMLDIALGGHAAPPPNRPLTELEGVVATRSLTRVLQAYCEQWQAVLSLDMQIARWTHNVQQLQMMQGGDGVYLVDYELYLGSSRGRLEWYLPWEAMRPMWNRLAANPARH